MLQFEKLWRDGYEELSLSLINKDNFHEAFRLGVVLESPRLIDYIIEKDFGKTDEDSYRMPMMMLCNSSMPKTLEYIKYFFRNETRYDQMNNFTCIQVCKNKTIEKFLRNEIEK